MAWPLSKTRKIRCPDGTTKTIFRNPDDAFPLALKSAQASMKAKVKDTIGFEGSVEGKRDFKVDALLVALDAKNNSLMMKFRAAYVVFAGDPCCQNIYFAKRVEQIMESHDRLASVEIKIQGYIDLVKTHPTNTAAINSVYFELVKEIRSEVPELNRDAATKSIEESRANAAQWIGGAHSPAPEPTDNGELSEAGT